MKIFIAGHMGLVGGALIRILSKQHKNIILTADRADLDLRNRKQLEKFFDAKRPDILYLAAARVGSIKANLENPADFLEQNIEIQANVFSRALKFGIKKLLFFGSNCMYPSDALQPIRESALLTGTIEASNEPYAIAKIAGVKLCHAYNTQYSTDYRIVVPCSLYGPGDNYKDGECHVIPSLLKKFHQAKEAQRTSVELWGTGKPLREFLFVDDLARACDWIMHMTRHQFNEFAGGFNKIINIGSGQEISIIDLARMISNIVNYQGDIINDPSKPDGALRKLLDHTKMSKSQWSPKVNLREGLELAYADFRARLKSDA